MSDIELICSFQCGDWKAIEELLDRYTPLLKSLSKSFYKTGFDHCYDFRDLSSDLKTHFILFVKRYDTTTGAHFSSYIKTMLFWKITNITSENYKPNWSFEALQLTPSCVDEVFANQEEDDKFDSLVDALTDRQKQIITLRHLNQYSLQEIASELGLSKSTIASHERLAYTKLKKVI